MLSYICLFEVIMWSRENQCLFLLKVVNQILNQYFTLHYVIQYNSKLCNDSLHLL